MKLELQGLHLLSNLRSLDVSSNRLSSLDGLTGLTNLQDLWADGNAISSLPALADSLKTLGPSLTCISFCDNPVHAVADCTSVLKSLLPNLKELDSNDLE